MNGKDSTLKEKQQLNADIEESWLWAWNICGFTTKDKQEYDQLYRVSRETAIEATKKLISDGILIPKATLKKRIEALEQFTTESAFASDDFDEEDTWISRKAVLAEIEKD